MHKYSSIFARPLFLFCVLAGFISSNVNAANPQRSGASEPATALLQVYFKGMSGVHTQVRKSDGVAGLASGKRIARSRRKSSLTGFTVPRGIYDVTVRKGGATYLAEDVDCRSGRCEVNDITSRLRVLFPGLSGVHVTLRSPDGLAGSASGAKVMRSRKNTNAAEFIVLRQNYDIVVRKNGAFVVVDNVDCSSGKCETDRLSAELRVNFHGLSGVRVAVSAKVQSDSGEKQKRVAVARKQENRTLLHVLPMVYDVDLAKGGVKFRTENVDCRSGSCSVESSTALLRVNFPGLSGVHIRVAESDGIRGKATGKRLVRRRKQNESAKLTVFAGIFDVILKKGPDVLIIDDVDCTSGTCTVDETTAQIVISFTGLKRVHSDIRIPDGIPGKVSGKPVSRSNHQVHQTTIAAFRKIYDVRVRHIGTSIFDDVDCRSGGCRVEVPGNVQVSLIDGDLNQPIAEQSVKALKILEDGKFARVGWGITNPEGLIHFPLDGLDRGQEFVLLTKNPFGEGKKFFSQRITQAGPFAFVISRTGNNELDLEPPKIAIQSPASGQTVPSSGFQVTGTATDNRGIARIEAVLDDPVKGRSIIPIQFFADANDWSGLVTEAMISDGSQNTTLTLTAYDQAANQSSASARVSVASDTAGPQITVTSHQPGDSVPETGFQLSGTIADQAGVFSLTVTLQDPVLGVTINAQPVTFSDSGVWSVAVGNGNMTAGQSVQLTLHAADVVGNNSTHQIDLVAAASSHDVEQLVNRATFGATPALLQAVQSTGTQAYLNQQLLPGGIDDSAFDARIAGLNPTTKQELQSWSLMHMIHSRKQLLEVMTWFWDNHFNTNINVRRNNANGVEVSNNVSFELAENQGFRANALGNFRDLLGISAKSPSMLIYLDSISNVVNDSNENYTREVLELHTMGVNGGYTSQDIEAGAEILTGWHLQNGAFFFDASQHNSQAQNFLGISIPAGGLIQGETLLDIIASHPSTASYLCEKLVTLFVSDTPPQSLVSQCANRFLAASVDPDQLAQVVRTILESPEFYASENFRNKIKTPLEFVVAAVRNLNATTDASDLAGPVAAMGIRLYENPVPTGWSEIGEDWINAALLIERVKWINQLVRRTPGGSESSVDPLSYFQSNGANDADRIVGLLMRVGLNNDYTSLAYQQAIHSLGPNGISLSDADADNRLRTLQGAVFSYPQYQFQ